MSMFWKGVVLCGCLLIPAGASAGFKGPGAVSKVLSVEAVGGLKDDSRVVLEGFLVKQIRDEHYLFRDETGTIEVEIDDEDFRGLDVTPKTRVRILGEVDKDRNSVTVDVDSLEILEKR